jgi:hypothetical protein
VIAFGGRLALALEHLGRGRNAPQSMAYYRMD